MSRNDSVEVANQRRLLRTLEQLTHRLKRTLARQPLSSFHVSAEMIEADPKSLEGRKAILSCRPGSVLKGRMCGESEEFATSIFLLDGVNQPCGQNEKLDYVQEPQYTQYCFYFTNAVQCPVGTYFSVEHRECASCWLGSYQDQEGQVECKSCPSGSSTAYLHSRSVAECKGELRFTQFVFLRV